MKKYTHLLLLLLFFAAGPAVQAQEATPASTAVAFTFADLGEKDLVFRLIDDQMTVHFALAAGQRVSDPVLQLHLAHGKKLLPETSELTVALNGAPVANIPLTADNAETVLPLSLPLEALHTGDNVLMFRFHLRLRSTGCADVGSTNLWARVRKTTAVTFATTDTPLPLTLAGYPAPFNTFTTQPPSPQISFVVPVNPSAAELTAVSQIAASLGQNAQWHTPPLFATPFDQLSPAHTTADHLIVIDTAGDNPLAAGAEAGLTLAVSPYNPNRLMLVVAGDTAESLAQSAALLATQSAWVSFNGPHQPPTAVTPLPLAQPNVPASFAELGFADKTVRGIGQHDLYYALDIPYDWKITSDAGIQLLFTHARTLDPDTSTMQAFINGFEVANLALTNRNDDNGRLDIQLAPRQLHPGRNWLHLHFDLHVRREDCNFAYREEAWATLSAANSSLNLAHVQSLPPLELRYFPSPLVTPGDLSQTLFVLADAPSADELTALVQMAARLGTYTTADGLRPRAKPAGQFDPADTIHAVTIGSPQSNAHLAHYADSLGLPPAADSSSLQLLTAPWGADNQEWVVLTAVNPADLAQITAILPTMGSRLKLQGNVALVNRDGLTGLTVGQLAGATLTPAARTTLAGLLIGTFVLIGLVGWWMVRRQQKAVSNEE